MNIQQLATVLDRFMWSLPDAVARALADILLIDQADDPTGTSLGNVCPQCQNTTLRAEEGYQKSISCNRSQC